MTARRLLRRVLLAALLCALLVSAALAADSIDEAVEKLKTAVENGDTSFIVSLPDDGARSTYVDAMEKYILTQVNWVNVSPRVTSGLGIGSGGLTDAAIPVYLRYAKKTGDYDKALDEAVSACIRDGMTGLEKTASIYSWLADTIETTNCIFNYTADEWANIAYCGTAYEALVDKRADCFGIAAAFRAIAQKAGLECVLVRGTYASKEHAWNAVKIGETWYYVDASRADSAWTPGHADYAYLLFGTDKSGYSATIEDENITISSGAHDLGVERWRLFSPLILIENEFWLVLRNNSGTALYSVPYGADFAERQRTKFATLSGEPMDVFYAAVMVDGVVYCSAKTSDTNLHSFVPGAQQAVEVRETGLSAKFGIRVSGRKLELVQGGTTALTMPLRRYSDITKGAWLAYDADAAPETLSTANVRLIGGTDGAHIIAAFYDSAGRMLSAQITGAAAPSFDAAPGRCTEVRLFAVSAEGAPLTAKLILTK